MVVFTVVWCATAAFGQSNSLVSNTMWPSDSVLKQAISRNSYFTAEFLQKVPLLWFTKDAQGIINPGCGIIDKKEKSGVLQQYEEDVYHQFDQIAIRSYGKQSLKPGDTLDIFHSDPFIKYGAYTTKCVRRVGQAIVSIKKGELVFATIIKMWDIVKSGDRVGAATHFSDYAISSIVDPTVAIKGTVFLRSVDTERSYLFHTFIIDRGSKDGVAFGDIFSVSPKNASSQTTNSAIACVVSCQESSSTLVIEKLVDNNIAIGDTITLVKRCVFKK